MSNPKTAQALPPKMLAEFVTLGKKGEALLSLGNQHTFIRGNQIIEVVILGKDSYGSVRKAAPGEVSHLKAVARSDAEDKAKLDAEINNAN